MVMPSGKRMMTAMRNTSPAFDNENEYSLIEEMYLTGEVKRDWLVDYVKNKQINYSRYGR